VLYLRIQLDNRNIPGTLLCGFVTVIALGPRRGNEDHLRPRTRVQLDLLYVQTKRAFRRRRIKQTVIFEFGKNETDGGDGWLGGERRLEVVYSGLFGGGEVFKWNLNINPSICNGIERSRVDQFFVDI